MDDWQPPKPNDLFVFLDETGSHPYKFDGKYPLFGLGGFATSNLRLSWLIKPEWNRIKSSFFPEFRNKYLHASEIDLKNVHGINAISAFFQNIKFHRFAAVVKNKTETQDSISNLNAIVGILFDQVMRQLIHDYRSDRVMVVVEESQHLQQIGGLITQYKYYKNNLHSKKNRDSSLLSFYK